MSVVRIPSPGAKRIPPRLLRPVPFGLNVDAFYPVALLVGPNGLCI